MGTQRRTLKVLLVLSLTAILIGLPQTLTQNATSDEGSNPQIGNIKCFSDGQYQKTFEYPAEGTDVEYISVPTNVSVSDARINISGSQYLSEGNRTDNDSTAFNAGSMTRFIVDNNSIQLPVNDLKRSIWCPQGDNAFILGSNGYLSHYSGTHFHGIPTSESLNFTSGDWIDTDSGALLSASDGLVDQSHYGARLYLVSMNETPMDYSTITFPTTDPGAINFIKLNSDGVTGIIGGAYYPNQNTNHTIIYSCNITTQNVTLIQDRNSDSSAEDACWDRNNTNIIITERYNDGTLILNDYCIDNYTLYELLNGYAVGYPHIAIRSQGDYGLIISTMIGQSPPPQNCSVYDYDIETNIITNIYTNNYNMTDIEWDCSGEIALICGKDGLLMSFSNATRVFEDITTGTSCNLNSISWNQEGSEAIIVGDGGTALKYTVSPESIVSYPIQHSGNGIYISSITETTNNISAAETSWNATSNFRDNIKVYLSNDGGTNWVRSKIGDVVQFPTQDNRLEYKIEMEAYDTSDPPIFRSIVIHYFMPDNKPSNPYLNVGESNNHVWAISGEFDSQIQTDDFSDEINDYLSIGAPDSEGYIQIPLSLYSGSSGTMMISDIQIEYLAADFTIDSLYFSDHISQIGVSTDILANITNTGTLDADNLEIEFLCNDNSIGTVNTSIISGDTVSMVVNWMPTIEGFNTITVIVDPSHNIGGYGQYEISSSCVQFVETADAQDLEIGPGTIQWEGDSIYLNSLTLLSYTTLTTNDLNIYIEGELILYDHSSISITNCNGFHAGSIDCGNNVQISFDNVSLINTSNLLISNSDVHISNVTQIVIADTTIDHGELIIDQPQGENLNEMTLLNITANYDGVISINNSQIETSGIFIDDGTISLSGCLITLSGDFSESPSSTSSSLSIQNSTININMSVADEIVLEVAGSGTLFIDNSTIQPIDNQLYSKVYINNSVQATINNCNLYNMSLQVHSSATTITGTTIRGAYGAALNYYSVSGIIIDSMILDSLSTDIYMENADIIALDTSLNDSRLTITGSSNFEKQYSLTVQVFDENTNPVSNASVEIIDNEETEIFNGSTNDTGCIENNIICTEYITQDLNNYINKTPHLIVASPPSYAPTYNHIQQSIMMIEPTYQLMKFAPSIGNGRSTADAAPYSLKVNCIRPNEAQENIPILDRNQKVIGYNPANIMTLSFPQTKLEYYAPSLGGYVAQIMTSVYYDEGIYGTYQQDTHYDNWYAALTVYDKNNQPIASPPNSNNQPTNPGSLTTTADGGYTADKINDKFFTKFYLPLISGSTDSYTYTAKLFLRISWDKPIGFYEKSFYFNINIKLFPKMDIITLGYVKAYNGDQNQEHINMWLDSEHSNCDSWKYNRQYDSPVYPAKPGQSIRLIFITRFTDDNVKSKMKFNFAVQNNTYRWIGTEMEGTIPDKDGNHDNYAKKGIFKTRSVEFNIKIPKLPVQSYDKLEYSFGMHCKLEIGGSVKAESNGLREPNCWLTFVVNT